MSSRWLAAQRDLSAGSIKHEHGELEMYLKLMLAALSVGLLSSTTVPAQEAGSVVVKTIVNTLKNDAGQPISFPRGHLELTVLSFDIPVGARLPVHKHKGQRYAYVLQGDLRVEQIGGASRIYHAGDFVVESVNRWHFGETVGTTPVKLVVIDQLPRGAKSTVLQAQHHR